ncbi:MAG: hypothetical protein Q9194_003126 [Teloschistes cf. exilis]
MHLLTLSLAFLPSIFALSPVSTPTSTTSIAPHPAVLILQTPPPQPQTPYLELRHLDLDKRQAVAAAGAPAAAAAAAPKQPAGGAAAPAAAPAVAPAAAPAAAPGAAAPVAAPAAAPAAGGLVGAHGDVPIAQGPATALTTAPSPKVGSIGMGTLTGKVGVVKTAEAKSEAGMALRDSRFASWQKMLGIGATIGAGVGLGMASDNIHPSNLFPVTLSFGAACATYTRSRCPRISTYENTTTSTTDGMGHLVTVAACALRQWVLDFEGNTARIIQSIEDLYLHCWEMLVRILQDDALHSILLDIGMPVQHRNVRYNCRIICLDGKILLIRPKMWLAGSGNYYEQRYFTPWMKPRQMEQYHLPRRLQKLQGATHVTFGDAVISTPDTCLAAETCEELFTPDAPHNSMGLDGVEVFTNSSGSHWTLRKLGLRLQLIQEATRKSGGVYIYSNEVGVLQKKTEGSQFSLKDVEVVVATVDLEEVRAYRSSASRGLQAAAKSTGSYERIQTAFALSSDEEDLDLRRGPSPSLEPRLHAPEEEIALGAGCWLWDYLRRSGAAGLLVPLSGGIDSCATAVCVFSMCRLVITEMQSGNEQVIKDVKRLARFSEHLPETAQDLCYQLFHTIYLGMSRQSSKDTRQRAKDLSTAIGAYHVDLDIDEVYEAQRNLIVNTLDFEPRFKVEEGTNTENMVLQNIQARSRMVTAYEFAQILPTTRKRPGGGGLLVLGSANVGESLRGYLTKYDCSSADINPIGAIDKQDLKRLIAWAEKEFEEFLTAVPTAELEPITESYTQSDEQDMGLSYNELTVFGRYVILHLLPSCFGVFRGAVVRKENADWVLTKRLRKENKLGPFGTFQRLVHEWSDERPRTADETAPALTPREVAEKVKRFFHYYAINRHKMTTLTPSLHSNDYSPDDNRFDQRPFLYPPQYDSWAFKKIDAEVEKYEKLRDKKRT